jgi:hypothetical protein
VPSEGKINSLLAIVDSVRPENELEAAVAIQLAATHELTMKALSYANDWKRNGAYRHGLYTRRLCR